MRRCSPLHLLLLFIAAACIHASTKVEVHVDGVVSDVALVQANTSHWRRLDGSSSGSNATTLCDLSLFEAYLASFGRDLYVNASLCGASIEYLRTRLAGGFGPVLQSDMEVVMCSTPCLSSDLLHVAAMEAAHCSCTELSSSSYITQDFCRENSARMLCSILGVCGTWGCGLHDFMCPRYEWDRHYPCAGAFAAPSLLLLLCLGLLHLLQTS